ncbi:chaplin [Streptantibioticus rubrisoli]|uniref:Chaplin n=1 Tax=Streptantibioticus rubrisoli TaxID=1387313 RepID=A0ABT1PBR9_9ACTN|nr:chaplin [Streptantibioticus rubrisoli]MCQ4041668.1 chaplin [Streptantibioticus rubrisoli]
MRQVAKKGLITVVATGGVLAVTGGSYAFADAGASGAAVGSPGVVSGNNVQVPVSVPVNACGNTVDVVGALNPTFGNRCANGSERHESGGYGHTGQDQGDQGHSGYGRGDQGHGGDWHSGYGHRDRDHGGYQGHQHSGGAQATAVAKGSPGVASGNVAQVPVDVPVNVCGNSVDVVGLLNPAFGNSCENGGGSEIGQAYNPPPQTVVPPVQGHQPQAPSTPVRHVNRPSVHHAMAHTQPLSTAAPTLAHTGADQIGTIGAASAGLLIGGYVLYRRGRVAKR